MQSSIVSSTLCLSLLASLAVAAPSEPTQSGASQNSGVLQTQKVGVLDTQDVLLAQNSSTQATKDLQTLQGTLLAVNENAQTIGAAQDVQDSANSGITPPPPPYKIATLL